MGLTLDEFALWLHLEDVYWAEQGRQSVDAVILATLLGGALLLGFTPWDSHDASSVLAATATVTAVLAISTIAALKGKYTSAVVGVLVALVGLVAAIRLAKPGSPWAQRRYAEGSGKLARATARGERSRKRYAAGRIGSAGPRPRSSRRSAPERGLSPPRG